MQAIRGASIENLEYFLLECEKLGEERRRIVELQQPYEENREKTMGIVLFKDEGTEKRKEKNLSYVEKKRKGTKNDIKKEKEKR